MKIQESVTGNNFLGHCSPFLSPLTCIVNHKRVVEGWGGDSVCGGGGGGELAMVKTQTVKVDKVFVRANLQCNCGQRVDS
jgi:hypothetical protein